MMTKENLTLFIKSEALRLGFDVCGIAKAEAVSEIAKATYTTWIENEHHGTMQYLQNNCDKRFDPTELVKGSKSIIVVAMSYAPKQEVTGIASYAIGKDYHGIIKERLYKLLNSINEILPVKGRAFCDSAPVLERYWAEKAGIGWNGRNRQLTIKGKGSYFFLGELIVDAELCYDTPTDNAFCGNCKRCLESCPTGALSEEGFDARKCLSYLTIEYRGELPDDIGKKMGDCFYGCDRCLKACPHNRTAVPNNIEDFRPKKELLEMDMAKWRLLTEEKYNALFADSAVERCGYAQLKRNISALDKEVQE